MNKIYLTNELSGLDWFIFTLVLFITFASVLYGHRLKSRSQNQSSNAIEILLMGRRLSLPLFVATLVATWYGGIFGVTAIAYEKGIFNFITQGVFWYITYILFAFFLVDKISKYQAMTLPHLVGQMFGPKSGKLAAIFNLFNVLPVAYVISIGIFIQYFSGLSFNNSMAIGLIIVLFYSLFGGFRAVVFSDLIQFFVMCTSVALILLFSISQFGSLNFLTEKLPENYFSLTGGETLSNTFIWGFIALSTLVDPNFYQRCFAAKSPAVAKKGILFATLIWFCFDLCTTFGAMYAKATMPDLDPNQSYLIYALSLLPDGLKGFVLAGILATILSTLDSYLFLAASTLSFDLWPHKKNNEVQHYKFFLIVSAIFVWLLALTFDGNIKSVWKTLGSYSASCLLLPVLYGHLFPKKLTDQQFLISCCIGVITVSFWKISPMLPGVDELYPGMLATGLSLVFFSRPFQLKL